MAKTITAAQRKKISEDILGRVRSHLNENITELDYEDSYGYGEPQIRTMTTLQESILYSVAAHVEPLILEALKGWEVDFERNEDSKVFKLTTENKALKAELKELRAIKELLETARDRVET